MRGLYTAAFLLLHDFPHYGSRRVVVVTTSEGWDLVTRCSSKDARDGEEAKV